MTPGRAGVKMIRVLALSAAVTSRQLLVLRVRGQLEPIMICAASVFQVPRLATRAGDVPPVRHIWNLGRCYIAPVTAI